jgi:hypothetical protein
MSYRLTTFVILFGACGCGPADPVSAPAPEVTRPADRAPSEKEKIEALIKHVEGLKDAVFVRNGTDYDAATAARFLRGKWDQAADVKSAKEFIDKVASVSSTSGKPYLIRFKDGKAVKAGDYLRAELEKIEKGER